MRDVLVQAVPSYLKLGFEKLVLVGALAPSCEGSARSIFNALSKHCYLSRFARVMLQGGYVLEVGVPPELAEKCAGVYMDLERMGLFTWLEIFAFKETKNLQMKHAVRGAEGL